MPGGRSGPADEAGPDEAGPEAEEGGVTATTGGAGVASATGGGVDHHRLEVLHRIGPPGASVLVRTAKVFLSTTPPELAALTQAVDRGDGAAVHQIAHRLRGAAANLGATSLSARCADLERLGEADRLAMLTPC